MGWPQIDPTSYTYSPQTATSNFFQSSFKTDEHVKDLHQYSLAQQYAAQFFNFHTPQRTNSTLSASQPPVNLKKKEPKRVPDKEKTEEYRARRLKNNESAKRSREARRRKEDEKDHKIMTLETHIRTLMQENQHLREQLQRHFPTTCMPNSLQPQPFYS